MCYILNEVDKKTLILGIEEVLLAVKAFSEEDYDAELTLANFGIELGQVYMWLLKE